MGARRRLADQASRQAAWVVALFLANFLLQRFALPGLPVPVTTPLAMLWVGAALWARVVEINFVRLTAWLLGASVSALLTVPQLLLVDFPLISVNSWALWMTIWLPMVVQFRDRSALAHRRALAGIGDVGVGLGVVSIVFVLTQVIGIPYRDYLSEWVPQTLLVQDYVITYPISYGSPIYKANGWLALEPSFLSFMLGVAAVSAVLARAHWVKVLLIGLGLACTTAGSGMAVLGVFVVVTLLRGRVSVLAPYLAVGIPAALVMAGTSLGASVTSRFGEASDSRSSLSLRAIEPYQQLLPRWVAELPVALIGRGAGSSQRVINDLGVTGLLVPTPAKLLFDYGLLGGSLLLGVVVLVYLRSGEPAFALALALSMLAVQAASQPLVLCSLLAVTFFAPRSEEPVPVSAEPAARRSLRPPVPHVPGAT